MIHDAEKNTWSVVLPLSLAGQGAKRSRSLSGPSRDHWSGRGVSSRRLRAYVVLEMPAVESVAVQVRVRTFGLRGEDPCRLKPTMMPVSLLIALLLAFGIEPAQPGVPQSDVIARVLETCGGVTLVATSGVRARVVGFVSGLPFRLLAPRGSAGGMRSGPGSSRSSRCCVRLDHSLGRLVQDGADELGAGWIDSGRRLRRLPALSLRFSSWSGGVCSSRSGRCRSVRDRTRRAGSGDTCSQGAAVARSDPAGDPVVRDQAGCARPFFPGWDENALAEPIEIAVLGAFVLAVSPLFVRLAWPTRSLPPGPLRRRLDAHQRRASASGSPTSWSGTPGT